MLHVDAMPVWIIRLRFYEVYAQNDALERIPAGFKDVGSIITHLNEIYRQACIKFAVADPAHPIQELQVLYEAAPADHKLNSGTTNGTVSGEQVFLFERKLPEMKGINVFVLREFTSKARLGFSKRDSWDNKLAVQTKPFEFDLRLLKEFENTIAHEIGHLLNMSVHDYYNSVGDAGRRHDWGAFPERYYYKRGGMVPAKDWVNLDALSQADRDKRMRSSLMGGNDSGLDPARDYDYRWIRHEDWQEANKKAPEFGDLDN